MAIPGTGLVSGMVLRSRTICWDPDTEQIGLNIRHWLVGLVVGGSATDLAAAGQLDADLFAPMKNVLGDDVEYVGVGCQIVLNPVGPLPAEQVVQTNRGLGSLAFPTSAGQLCAFTKFFTTIAGRSGRGRIYYPFVNTNAYEDDNVIKAAYKTLYDVPATVYANQVVVPGAGADSAQLIPIITNASELPVRPGRPVAIAPYTQQYTIVDFQTKTEIATQRRRSAFGRTNLNP